MTLKSERFADQISENNELNFLEIVHINCLRFDGGLTTDYLWVRWRYCYSMALFQVLEVVSNIYQFRGRWHEALAFKLCATHSESSTKIVNALYHIVWNGSLSSSSSLILSIAELVCARPVKTSAQQIIGMSTRKPKTNDGA